MYGNTMTPEKTCKNCGSKSFGSQGQCKPCRAKWQSKWRKNNLSVARASANNWHKRHPAQSTSNGRRQELKKYGLTPDGYEQLLLSQGGKCAVCTTDKPNGPGGRYFFVDHDHATGKVRGLLCSNCNSILGHAKDSVQTLRRAISYLGGN